MIQIIYGLTIIAVVGKGYHYLIEPESFGGWILTVVLTLITYSVIKKIAENVRR